MALSVIIVHGTVQGHFSIHFLTTFFHFFFSFLLLTSRLPFKSLFTYPLLIANIFCSVVSGTPSFHEFWLTFTLSLGDIRTKRWTRSRRLWSDISQAPSVTTATLPATERDFYLKWKLKIEEKLENARNKRPRVRARRFSSSSLIFSLCILREVNARSHNLDTSSSFRARREN